MSPAGTLVRVKCPVGSTVTLIDVPTIETTRGLPIDTASGLVADCCDALLAPETTVPEILALPAIAPPDAADVDGTNGDSESPFPHAVIETAKATTIIVRELRISSSTLVRGL